MITTDFAHATLIPLELSETSLTAVSGYVSPSALAWFLSSQGSTSGQKNETGIHSTRLNVLVGMAHHGGVTKAMHHTFQQLCENSHGRLRVFYPPERRAIHSKVFVWSTDEGRATRAFSGSANFTNAGLNLSGSTQENVMHEVGLESADRYVRSAFQEAIECRAPDIDAHIDFPLEISYGAPELANEVQITEAVPARSTARSARFYLYYTKKGQRLAYRSGGINWGHRGDRNRNEAQLKIESALSRSEFLPHSGTPFTVMCDDGATLILQGTSGSAETGKNLSSHPHNYILGAYIRRRMGLEDGQHVGLKELENYGRGYVTLTRCDDKAFDYFLDFSVVPGAEADWGDD